MLQFCSESKSVPLTPLRAPSWHFVGLSLNPWARLRDHNPAHDRMFNCAQTATEGITKILQCRKSSIAFQSGTRCWLWMISPFLHLGKKKNQCATVTYAAIPLTVPQVPEHVFNLLPFSVSWVGIRWSMKWCQATVKFVKRYFQQDGLIQWLTQWVKAQQQIWQRQLCIWWRYSISGKKKTMLNTPQN